MVHGLARQILRTRSLWWTTVSFSLIYNGWSSPRSRAIIRAHPIGPVQHNPWLCLALGDTIGSSIHRCMENHSLLVLWMDHQLLRRVIDWIIKVLITHRALLPDVQTRPKLVCPCLWLSVPPVLVVSLESPSLPLFRFLSYQLPSSHPPLVTIYRTVFRAMANYLLHRSMNSNRNYISPDIQLVLPIRPCYRCLRDIKEKDNSMQKWQSGNRT